MVCLVMLICTSKRINFTHNIFAVKSYDCTCFSSDFLNIPNSLIEQENLITLWVQCGPHQCSNLGLVLDHIRTVFRWLGAESQDALQSKRIFMDLIELFKMSVLVLFKVIRNSKHF